MVASYNYRCRLVKKEIEGGNELFLRPLGISGGGVSHALFQRPGKILKFYLDFGDNLLQYPYFTRTRIWAVAKP
jgi:hypothetical protein